MEANRAFALAFGLALPSHGIKDTVIIMPLSLFVIIFVVVFTFFIVAGFGLPTIWTRMRPENDKSAKSWTRFASEGIMTHTGRLAAKDATIQVLILPVLVLLWGFAVVTIAATV